MRNKNTMKVLLNLTRGALAASRIEVLAENKTKMLACEGMLLMLENQLREALDKSYDLPGELIEQASGDVLGFIEFTSKCKQKWEQKNENRHRLAGSRNTAGKSDKPNTPDTSKVPVIDPNKPPGQGRNPKDLKPKLS